MAHSLYTMLSEKNPIICNNLFARLEVAGVIISLHSSYNFAKGSFPSNRRYASRMHVAPCDIKGAKTPTS
jgi:hypothetical protein